MENAMETRYQERLKRYVTAMRNGKPDRVPVRPFAAEFTAAYAGYDCQQVTHDYQQAFEAVIRCCADYDWDAAVPNMVYVWTGLTQAIGLNYYGIPGCDLSIRTGFQYKEPPEERVFMKADEYDALIDDPTGFLYNVWLPRVCDDVCSIGAPSTYRNNLSFVRGSMAMLNYFNAFGPQVQRMRDECGTVSAIAGIFKAPFDIIADKMRGYLGLTEDMMTQPDKVLAACQALAPHLYNVALGSSDPSGTVPIGFWMHRGCVPFITPGQFDSHYWPTLRPIIEELWKQGRQTLFYAEGDWGYHLDTFRQLPEGSIVFHADRTDPFKAHEKLGDRFCISGGVPNVMLAYGKPDQVRDHCRKLIETVGRDGGFILDASAIMQNDSKPENVQAMTDAAREFGVYSSGADTYDLPAPRPAPADLAGLEGWPTTRIAPGVCLPWAEKEKQIGAIRGDRDLVRSVWEANDAMANMYIWQLLLSF